MDNRTLLAVFAHPDDEAFGVGGTLTRYAAEGVDVYVVSATRGEAGQILEPAQATRANLPYIREQELRCACRTYGVHPPMFLDYVDGQLTIVHQGQAVGKLVRIIRELKPQVMITFGWDGIYGHYDHIAVHRWSTIAYQLAANRDCFPDLISDTCTPYQVSKLYYRVNTLKEVDAIAGEGQGYVDMDGVPFYFVGYRDEEITTAIDVSRYADVKLQGVRCHATQIGAQDPDEILGEDLVQVENYILARSTMPRPVSLETDLFAGLE